MMIRETRSIPVSVDDVDSLRDTPAANVASYLSELTAIDEVAPEDALDALQEVIDDIDEYILEWFQRLNADLVSESPSSSPDRDLRLKVKAFREEKRQWDAKREQEQREIRERAQQLSEAWLRLEDEQRLLLQRRDSHAAAPRERTRRERENRESEPHVHPEIRPDAEGRRDVAPTTKAEQAKGGQNNAEQSKAEQTNAHSARMNQPGEAAIRQFQQLRQEIESNRPPSGLA